MSWKAPSEFASPLWWLRSGNPGPPPDLLHPHWSLRTTGLIWFQTCGRSNRFPSVLAGGCKSFSFSWRSTEMFGMINHWTAAPLEPSRKNKDQKLLEHETIQNGRLNSAACFVIPSFFFHTDSTKNPSKKNKSYFLFWNLLALSNRDTLLWHICVFSGPVVFNLFFCWATTHFFLHWTKFHDTPPSKNITQWQFSAY